MLDTKIILETALNRDAITPVEALILLEESDPILPELFEAADVVNQRVNNNVATYIRSRKVHYTNVCRAECKFCPFWVKKNSRNAFVLKPREVVDRIGSAHGLKQIEIQGGLHPELGLAYHLELLHTIREAYPDVHVHGYSPVEIWYTARRERTTPHDVLRRMRTAGLGSLAGDSAVILNDKIRKKIAYNILRSYEWTEIIRVAHRLGLSTTATVLFGHIEDEVQLCEHLETIRTLQKRSPGIAAVTPVPFLPDGTWLAENRRIQPMTMEGIFRMIAVCRLFFGRAIKTITADWTKIGFPAAIKALSVGANDIGGLTFDKSEIHAPSVGARPVVEAARVRAAIQRAGRIPMERAPYAMDDMRRTSPWRPAWQQVQEPVFI